MNKIFSSTPKKLPIILGVAILTGCGGGGGGSDTKSGIPADFDLFAQSGTWRLTADIQFNLSPPTGDPLIDLDITSDSTISTVAAIDVSGDNITLNDCDAEAPETVTISELEDEISNDLSDEDLDCKSETTNYTKISSTNYRIEYNCDDSISTTITYKKISEATDFDFGQLSFTSSNGDLNTNSGVCGTISDTNVDTIVTPQPNSLSLTNSTIDFQSISIVAPYNGNRIGIDFEFTENVTEASYDVSSNEVEVELASVTYGGTPADPDYIEATSGNVNIDSIGPFAVTGTFNITTNTGDNIVGSFHFDIE